MTPWDQAQLAQLDATRAGVAIIAHRLHEISAQHDAHHDAIQQAIRASRWVLMEACLPNSIQNTFLMQVTDAAVRSRQTAKALDSAIEGLERLAAGLRDG